MTVLEAFNYTASQVDDISFGYFTKPQLLIYLNQAVQETQKKLIAAGNNWYLKKTDDSGPNAYFTVANQSAYTPPTDLLDINRLEIVQNPGLNENRIALTSITLNQKDYFNGYYTQFPAAFFFEKVNINLVPAPQTGGLLIRYWYTYRAAPLVNDGDTIDVPQEFVEYVVYQMILKCFAKDGRDPGYFLQMVKDIENRLERQAIMRAQDRAPSVIQCSDGSGYGGFY